MGQLGEWTRQASGSLAAERAALIALDAGAFD
jgi:hypothetical protein